MKSIQGESIAPWEEKLDLECFPTQFPKGRFGKHHQPRQVKLTESDYRVSRVLNVDGRFRRDIQYLFHLFHDSELKSLSSSIAFLLRMKSVGSLTAGDVVRSVKEKDEVLEANITSLLGNIRATKQYWNKRYGELRSMMDEFGPPTLFLTFAQSEYDWDDLLEHIRKINSDEKGILDKTPGELCSMDPVSVSRHFHRRFDAIFKEFILNKKNPVLGEVTHYMFRTEFQSRGSGHVHAVLWIRDAPVIGVNSSEEILNFIQERVTCKIPNEKSNPQLRRFVKKYQMHRCKRYCRRRYRNKNKYFYRCRFGFPRASTRKAVLHDVIDTVKRRLKGQGAKRLYELVRDEKETFVNDYNPTLLLAWGGNMDVQFIMDKNLAIARYITAYITKAEKCELDDLWADLSNETLRGKLYALGLKALSSRSCSAEEVVDMLLGTRLYRMSEMTRFVNTLEPEQRKRCLKPFVELQSMPEKSKNIFTMSFVDDYYPNRPKDLETMNLYDFCRFFDRVPKAKVILGRPLSANQIRLQSDLGVMQKRTKPYLIQHKHFDKNKSNSNLQSYCRTMLMLFYPYRDESELLGDFPNYHSAFVARKDELESMMKYHEQLEYLRDVQKELDEALSKADDENDQVQIEDESNAVLCGRQLVEAELAMCDVLGAFAANENQEEECKHRLASLNVAQRRVFDKIANALGEKSAHENLLLFVSGCGGTGKSFLIHCLKDWVNCQFPPKKGKVSICVTAPTGLAAKLVDGMTIHRVFNLPVDRTSVAEFVFLQDEALKALRNTLGNVKLIILDEISLVSSLTLLYIHLRLTEISGKNSEPMGGFNMVVFGDLLQMSPVNGDPVFIKVPNEVARKKIGSVCSFDLWDLFEYDELTENVRQASDPTFQEMLTNLRVGMLTEENLKMLRSRLIPKEKDLIEYHLGLPKNAVSLMPKISQCQEYNFRMLQYLKGEIVKIPAIDRLDGLYRGSKKDAEDAWKLLNNLKDDVNKTAGLESRLELSLQSRVMLRRNISVEDGLVNGAIGTVVGFKKSLEGVVEKLTIKFEKIDEPQTIERYTARFELVRQLYVHRSQFPLSLAYALTIHKSQGLTMENLMLDVGSGIFGTGMTYVAMSRVTSLEGLHLINFDPSKVKIDFRCVREYNRLRKRFTELPDLPVKLVEKRDKKAGAVDPASKKRNMGPTDVNDAPVVSKKPKVQSIDLVSSNQFGFVNYDGKSCYANSLIQCLQNLEPFKGRILASENSGPVVSELRSIFQSQTAPLSLKNLRRAVSLYSGETDFTERIQQDSSEFFLYMLRGLAEEGLGNIEDIFKHSVENLSRCRNCNIERVRSEERELFQMIHFGEVTGPDITFKEARDWKLTEITCNNCGSFVESKTRISVPPDVLVVLLARFSSNRLKISTGIKGFSASRLLKIDNQQYRLNSSVNHLGGGIEDGHYVSLVRDNKAWVRWNDLKCTVQKNFVPKLRDVYLLFLTKV